MALLTQLRGKAGGNSCRFGTFINRKVARRFARHFFGSSQISSGFNFGNFRRTQTFVVAQILGEAWLRGIHVDFRSFNVDFRSFHNVDGYRRLNLSRGYRLH